MIPSMGSLGAGQGSSVNPDLSATSGNGDFAGGGIGANTFNFAPPPIKLGGTSLSTTHLMIGGALILGVVLIVKKS